MIGTGPELDRARRLAEGYGLTNLTFIEWLEREELRCRIAAADLVLGVFGTTRQVTLTNNNKIYEGFSMHKPVVSGETPSLPDCLEHGTHLYLCQRGSPQSLADAVIKLKSDPELCQRLADNGEKVFHEHFSVTQIGRQLAGHLEELLAVRQKK
jgi:glycosyltransferase involved in cell wall biosynthesis